MRLDATAEENIYVQNFVAWGNLYRSVVSSSTPNWFAPENCGGGFYCSVWSTPSSAMHPSHSRAFVRNFSRFVISPHAARLFRSLLPTARASLH